MALVDLESDGSLRVLTINAPDRLNALDWPLLQELREAVEAIDTDPRAAALVVLAAGETFSSGADLETLFGDVSRPVEELRDHLMRIYSKFIAIHTLDIPTVVAVQGGAMGVGLNLVLSCDVIVAGKDAYFGPDFANLGLHPGGGLGWLLAQRIGAAQAAAALYSGESISAEAALRLGIAHELADDPRARARELGERYASRNPKTMRSLKRSMTIAARSDIRASVEFESMAQAESLRTVEFATRSRQSSDARP